MSTSHRSSRPPCLGATRGLRSTGRPGSRDGVGGPWAMSVRTRHMRSRQPGERVLPAPDGQARAGSDSDWPVARPGTTGATDGPEEAADPDHESPHVSPSPRRAAQVTAALGLTLTALLLGLGAVAGAGPVRLVLSVAALVVLVRLNANLDPSVIGPDRAPRRRSQELP